MSLFFGHRRKIQSFTPWNRIVIINRFRSKHCYVFFHSPPRIQKSIRWDPLITYFIWIPMMMRTNPFFPAVLYQRLFSNSVSSLNSFKSVSTVLCKARLISFNFAYFCRSLSSFSSFLSDVSSSLYNNAGLAQELDVKRCPRHQQYFFSNDLHALLWWLLINLPSPLPKKELWETRQLAGRQTGQERDSAASIETTQVKPTLWGSQGAEPLCLKWVD